MGLDSMYHKNIKPKNDDNVSDSQKIDMLIMATLQSLNDRYRWIDRERDIIKRLVADDSQWHSSPVFRVHIQEIERYGYEIQGLYAVLAVIDDLWSDRLQALDDKDKS